MTKESTLNVIEQFKDCQILLKVIRLNVQLRINKTNLDSIRGKEKLNQIFWKQFYTFICQGKGEEI